MNIFDKRIIALQEQMEKDGIKAYIIRPTDCHMSEESAPHFTNTRFYFCPFKGQDGDLLVTLDNYYIYADGRYWVQAEKDLKGSCCTLVYVGKADTKSMAEFIKEENLYPLGLDASTFSYSELKAFYKDKDSKIKHIRYIPGDENLPPLPKGKIWEVANSYLTETREERVKKILDEVNKVQASSIVVSTLDDISYILGYRGNDISCTPIFYSYLFIEGSGKIHLFIDKDKLEEDFPKDIEIHPYEDFYSFLNTRDEKISVDPDRNNALIVSKIKHPVFQASPAVIFKAIKGKVEIENTKEIQAIDGLSVLKLMKYVDDNIDKGELTELSCARYIDSCRRENSRCFDLSFNTIAAVDSNAAMMHYGPTEDDFSPVTRDNQILLVDSGGQYFGGTTDTTRTFILSKKVSKDIKRDYTLTLKSQIALTTSIFEKGCSGKSLDIKAREIMWKNGTDYKCGTGHGVGYISCVHEGPISFRYNRDSYSLLPGHIITVEPGVYKANRYGIRLENDLLVTEGFTNDDGIYYKFETITYVPYDLRGIDKSLLTKEEISWFNFYNELVREKLLPLIKGDKKLVRYLKKNTKKI